MPVADQLLAFYRHGVGDQHHRGRSWEHCFSHFLKARGSRDESVLHLASYLASWGMYRGSSFLLQRDYMVHKHAVRLLKDSRYDRLWNPAFANPAADDESINLILSLAGELRRAYGNHIEDPGVRSRNPTDTLVTKILLGTMACTPATDRYFIAGFKQSYRYSRFGAPFLKNVLEFSRTNALEFRKAGKEIQKMSRIQYPLMKLVDMYFWSIGMERGENAA